MTDEAFGDKSVPTYTAFVCHAWQYSEEYRRVCELLEGTRQDEPCFECVNTSSTFYPRTVTPASPLESHDHMRMLGGQIRAADCIIGSGELFLESSYWIRKEFDIARSYRKPIIGLMRGPVIGELDSFIESCSVIVKWNSDHLREAIIGTVKHSLGARYVDD